MRHTVPQGWTKGENLKVEAIGREGFVVKLDGLYAFSKNENPVYMICFRNIETLQDFISWWFRGSKK